MRFVAPYFGDERVCTLDGRGWKVKYRLHPGWYEWEGQGRKARNVRRLNNDAPEVFETLMDRYDDTVVAKGYLIGDRFLHEGEEPRASLRRLSQLFFLPPTERFTEVEAILWPDTHWVFVEDLGLTPQSEEANRLFEGREEEEAVKEIPVVSPRLLRAFRFESWIRSEAERRRAEEEQRIQEEIRKADAAERARILEVERRVRMATLEGRVREALHSMGARFTSARDSLLKTEAVVRYQYRGKRLECVVRKETLGIVDAGICLTDHRTNRKHDARLTLRALVTVVDEAINTQQLVVWRRW